MRLARSLAPLLTVAALAAATGDSTPLDAQGPPPVSIAAQASSGVWGSAWMADLGNGKTQVDVRLTPASGDFPTLIHDGPCASPNPAPRYALADVQNGVSTTQLSVPVADLTRGPMSINVHQSPQDIATIVACGDLVVPTSGGATVLPPGGEPVLPVRPLASLALFALGSLGLVLRRLGPAGARPARDTPAVPER
jgi:hypothetical protein